MHIFLLPPKFGDECLIDYILFFRGVEATIAGYIISLNQPSIRAEFAANQLLPPRNFPPARIEVDLSIMEPLKCKDF